MIKRLVSSAIPAPRFRYTPCIQSGPLYTVSGMVGLDFTTGSLAPGGVAAETRQILNNLKAALIDYGIGFEHMISARIYVVPFEQFGAVNAVWEEFFADIPPPARTSVGVSALPLGAQIEIEFTFYREG